MGDNLVSSDAGQQARLLVASSTACDLVKVDAPVEEIRRALSPDVRRALPVAIRSVAQELAPGSIQEQEQMAIALGRQIGLLKAGLRVEDKDDWIAIALEEIIHLPPAMVLEALRDVRRRARYEGDVVPAVLDIVDPKVAQLSTEHKRLARLEEIAG